MPSQLPQLENGHLSIANELFDAIVGHPFSKREYKVVLAVIRKTYGYRKKSDDMTMTQLAEVTGLQLPHVSATVRELDEKNVLLIRSGRYGKVIGLSKDYRNWKKAATAKKVTKTVSDQNGNVTESVTTGDQNSHQGLPKQSSRVTKTVNTKDNPKRQLQKTTPKNSRSDATKAAAAATWKAYSNAYQDRYSAPPVRNAKVNRQLLQFVDRVPLQEAPEIAAFFVSHNGRFYVQRMHSVGMLLMDAEKLRTEWITNRKVTATSAAQADRTEATGQVFGKLIAEAEANGR